MYRFVLLLLSGCFFFGCSEDKSHPEKIAVLTFDDAVQSHLDVVAPLLQEMGFGATFFVSHKWMTDTANFMSWDDIAALHEMGFEIGNHTWTHDDFAVPKNAARLAGELALVELQLRYRGVPRPISFAYTGNFFAPQTWQVLAANGIRFARRGMQPEMPYGEIQPGPLYDPLIHHPLLIPTAGDAYPEWTFSHFKQVVDRAEKGKIVVLQFHGVPDIAHAHVHTPPDSFRLYMNYLKAQGFQVIAMRDLEAYLPKTLPEDSMLAVRYTRNPDADRLLPEEMIQTRRELPFWLENMLVHHRYSLEEAAQVTGYPLERTKQKADSLGIPYETSKRIPGPKAPNAQLKVLPYPGGRHPRIGFLDGAIDPMRGTKASIFLPWDTTQYLVVDVPEAIFSQIGLTFLAHTHLPTIWDEQNLLIHNQDWQRQAGGVLQSNWVLPNNVAFGATIRPQTDAVEMELWLTNGSEVALDSLKTQVCILLKGAPDFAAQTESNKQFSQNVAATRAGDKWVLTAWERPYHPWGNTDVPCMHVDPKFLPCAPGETVRLRGRIWFYEGDQIDAEIQRAASLFP